MPKIKIRPVTVLLLVAAAACIAVAVVYMTETAHNLPSLFPGHDVHSFKHHYKHGLAFITLGVLALGAAWFTTNPNPPDQTEPPGPSSN